MKIGIYEQIINQLFEEKISSIDTGTGSCHEIAN